MILIDRSNTNGPPNENWAAVRAAGVSGVMLKATEGVTFVDPYFGDRYRAAKAAGLHAGAYHFWHPELDLNTQLSWFHTHYGPAAGDLPPWWDSEINPTNRSWAQLGADLKAAIWCLAVAYGDAMVYLTRSWAAALEPQGFNPATQFALAQGSASPVLSARIMQLAPAPIPGIAGLTDWSVTP